MFYKIKKLFFEKLINKLYTNSFIKNGPVAKSVFWNSEESQNLRFMLSLDIINKNFKNGYISLADIGCGYGALYKFILRDNKYKQILYSGYDLNRQMISYCKEKYPNSNHFFQGSKPIKIVDYCIFVGTFNLCYSNNYMFWKRYIFDSLINNWKFCNKGIILNITSKKVGNIENNIFYSDNNFKKDLEREFGKVKCNESSLLKNNTTYLINK